jgi:hypothetical protein
MAGEEVMGTTSHRALAAVLFMGGVYIAFDACSTVNSSPWTHRTFTSPEKLDAGKYYVLQSIGVSLAFGAASSAISHEPWPLLGVMAADGYLYWLYRGAFHAAMGIKPHGLALVPATIEASVSTGASSIFGGLV